MIKNIVFDVGNVLVNYDPNLLRNKISYSDEEWAIARKNVFDHLLWRELDRGTLSEEDAPGEFVKGDPEHADLIRNAYAHAKDTIEKYEYAKPWVMELKERGYRLYVLSNYSGGLLEQTKDKMEFLPFMDGTVFSYECGMIKPEPAIYRFLCEKYKLNPKECVFMDDRQENVEAAIAYGMKGICFINERDSREKLEALIRQNS